jgi:hypothetical protein
VKIHYRGLNTISNLHGPFEALIDLLPLLLNNSIKLPLFQQAQSLNSKVVYRNGTSKSKSGRNNFPKFDQRFAKARRTRLTKAERDKINARRPTLDFVNPGGTPQSGMEVLVRLKLY